MLWCSVEQLTCRQAGSWAGSLQRAEDPTADSAIGDGVEDVPRAQCPPTPLRPDSVVPSEHRENQPELTPLGLECGLLAGCPFEQHM